MRDDDVVSVNGGVYATWRLLLLVLLLHTSINQMRSIKVLSTRSRSEGGARIQLMMMLLLLLPPPHVGGWRVEQEECRANFLTSFLACFLSSLLHSVRLTNER